jgi:hypothetical protein
VSFLELEKRKLFLNIIYVEYQKKKRRRRYTCMWRRRENNEFMR